MSDEAEYEGTFDDVAAAKELANVVLRRAGKDMREGFWNVDAHWRVNPKTLEPYDVRVVVRPGVKCAVPDCILRG